jgi:hypothetical protein
MNRRRQNDAAARFKERRQRENDAPRLQEEVPGLQTLRLELEEFRKGGTTPLVSHTRHVVVQRAPALFLMPCGERDCVDGGHDLTRQMLRELESSSERFEGEHECDGLRNGATCNHTLRYRAQASYSA